MRHTIGAQTFPVSSELGKFIAGWKGLIELVGSYNAMPLLNGQNIFIHDLDKTKAEDLKVQLADVGLFVNVTESSKYTGKYTLLTHL